VPIVVVFEFPGEDVAKYHKVFEAGGPAINQQPQRTEHLCYRTGTASPSSTSGRTRPRSRPSAR
jgi:hypothetical protein